MREEIRASATALEDMRSLWPSTGSPLSFIDRVSGIPVVVDPSLPEHMAVIVGPEKPFDPNDPIAERREIRFLDFRPKVAP